MKYSFSKIQLILVTLTHSLVFSMEQPPLHRQLQLAEILHADRCLYSHDRRVCRYTHALPLTHHDLQPHLKKINEGFAACTETQHLVAGAQIGENNREAVIKIFSKSHGHENLRWSFYFAMPISQVNSDNQFMMHTILKSRFQDFNNLLRQLEEEEIRADNDFKEARKSRILWTRSKFKEAKVVI